MKECSREKVLKGKKSQYDPPYPSGSSVGPGGKRDQEHGVVLHDQEEGYHQDQGQGVVLHFQGEVYQQPIFFMSGRSIYEC